MTIKVSQRGQSITPSSIRKLLPYADAAKKQGKTVYHLNIGQPDIETPKVFLDRLKNFNERVLAYAPSSGILEYQEVLVSYYKRYGIEVLPSDIIVTTAASEAILMAMTVCLDPGDEVLIPEPFYSNYNGYATVSSVNIVPIETRIEDGWKLPTLEEMEKLLTKKTRAIMISNPDNPTGKVYSYEELKKIVELALKHQLFIFSDEVYRELIFDGTKHISFLTFKEVKEQVILIDSISKRFSACGARIGAFVSFNKGIMASALCYAQARLASPTIEQYMACASKDLGDDYFKSQAKEYKMRCDLVLSGLEEMQGVRYKTPQGALYIIASLPVKDTEDFCLWLLRDFSYENQTVMLTPAAGFYKTMGRGKSEVRMAFVLNAEKTKKAMGVLKIGLETYLKTFKDRGI